MNNLELEKYFRNHPYADTDVKVEFNGQLYEIADIIWSGLENGNKIVIKIES